MITLTNRRHCFLLSKKILCKATAEAEKGMLAMLIVFPAKNVVQLHHIVAKGFQIMNI